jgi:spermidine/putrescine transport system substrate-binding protein
MRRRLFLGAAAFGACQTKNRLNVFNWSSYIAPETIPTFEREFGVQVRYGVFESAEELLARVYSGNSGWDVVFPSNPFVPPMRELGLLAELDHARLPLLDNLDARFRRPVWDPDVRHSIPYMWGATVIAYQTSLASPPRRWEDLWSDRFRGRVTMLDDSTEVFAACLKKKGRSVNSNDPDELREARNDAIAQKRVLRAYLNAEARDQLVAGDLLAAQAWTVTAQQAIDTAPGRLALVYPQEGFPIYADCVAILRESKRQEMAHRFLDYLLRPEVAARIAERMKTATCNGPARQHLPLEMQTSPAYYPSEETLAHGEWLTALDGPARLLRDRLWTEIKSA